MTAFTAGEKQSLLDDSYRQGAIELTTAFAESPIASREYQPVGSEWTIHEIVRLTRNRAATMMDHWPEAIWSNTGRHTETGPFPLKVWLRYNTNHLHVHAAQIRDNVRAFEGR